MLDEYMISLGFDDEQLKLLKNSYVLNRYSSSTILFNMKNMVNYLRRQSLSNKEIVSIILTIPDLVFTSIENIKSRVDEMASLKFNKIDTFNMIKEYPYLISLSFQKI